MSLHIEAKPGEIASTVLITGDPLRAKNFAESSLSEVFCFNKVRAMYGYTGLYKGMRISIMGTGIGIPSTALYLHELIHFYGVKSIIRLGTTGAIQSDIQLGEVIVADESQTDAKTVEHFNQTHQLLASAKLLDQVQQIASTLNVPIKVGAVYSTDLFYREDDATRWIIPSQQGVLSVDMETAVLYAMGKKYGIDCLAILTVSDNIITRALTPPQDRETKTSAMLRLALELTLGFE